MTAPPGDIGVGSTPLMDRERPPLSTAAADLACAVTYARASMRACIAARSCVLTRIICAMIGSTALPGGELGIVVGVGGRRAGGGGGGGGGGVAVEVRPCRVVVRLSFPPCAVATVDFVLLINCIYCNYCTVQYSTYRVSVQ